jgi:hypothetical protein
VPSSWAGSPSRGRGYRPDMSPTRAIIRAIIRSIISVENAPGAIALTLMPRAAHSTASTSVMRLIAALGTE